MLQNIQGNILKTTVTLHVGTEKKIAQLDEI
jgi:hypothetical protein